MKKLNRWKVAGWVMSLAIPLTAIGNPTKELLILTALILIYWGYKWRKPLAAVCGAAVVVITASWNFVRNRIKTLADRRSAKEVTKID